MTAQRLRLTRRQILKGLAFSAAAGLVGSPAPPVLSAGKKTKHVIVIAGFGGASIIDSFLAIRQSECPDFQNVNCFVDQEVKDIAGSPLRGVDLARDAIGAIPIAFQANQSDFVNKHKADMMVATLTGTSVNHTVAQKRSITGNGAFSGRTLQELVALEYGDGYLMPNVNMSTLGFAERGDDPTLPAYCYAEPVAEPALWPISLDGMRGLKGAPDRKLVDRARALRDDRLDPQSSFYRTFQKSERLARWRASRAAVGGVEAQDLVTKLNIFTDDPPKIPLAEFGLGSSPDAALMQATFPDFFTDPLEAQAALAFLLLKYRVSVAVTIAPTFNVVLSGSELANPPLAFDYSHNAHRAAQAVMWKRILGIVDRLVTLLKAEEYDATTGESFWDRTLIYVATDFGRSKGRLNGEDVFGSGHDLNNGVLVMSPFANGNKVLGGVDKATGMTYGFDPQTGAPDPTRSMTEGEIFAGIVQALSIDTAGAGLPAMPAMRKGG